MSDGMPPRLAVSPAQYGAKPRSASRVARSEPVVSVAPAHPCLAGIVCRAVRIGAAAILFAAGVCAGACAIDAWPQTGDWIVPAPKAEVAIMKNLKSELNLNMAQTAQIEPIVRAACGDLRLLSEEGSAQKLATLDEMSATISPLLMPSQQERLLLLQDAWQHKSRAVKHDQRIVSLF